MVETGSPALDIYRTMRLIRRFEERVVDLVNSNEIAGVTHEYVGQEAVAAGVCVTLEPDDIITSTHRGHGHLLARGASPSGMMAELLGRTTGLNRARGGSMHIADFSLGIYGANGMVAAGAPIAAGGVWGSRYLGKSSVGVTFFGDGAINQGVLAETMNLASVWNIPLVFCCENNGYAVTMPITRASRTSIAERAEGYGFPVTVVDGMDVNAVREATQTAVDRARAGGGPSFLECRTYRFFGHHTAERTQKLSYRTSEEIESWVMRDPIASWRERIISEDSSSASQLDRIDAQIEATLDEAVEFARSSPRPLADSALDYQYSPEPSESTDDRGTNRGS